MKISASKIKKYITCPKQFEFSYILKVPELEHDYFDVGRNVEECLWKMLQGEKSDGYSEEETKLALILLRFKPFREIIDGKKLEYQKKYETDEEIAYTDFETEEVVIDVKTSSMTWNQQTVEEYKYQAIMYVKHTGKKFCFVVINKKNYNCQIIWVTPKNLEDLDKIGMEIRTAVELGVFEKKASYKCKMCSYKDLCNGC